MNCFSVPKTLWDLGSTIHGKNLLLLEYNPTVKRDKTFLTELPPLKVSPFPLTLIFVKTVNVQKYITPKISLKPETIQFGNDSIS